MKAFFYYYFNFRKICSEVSSFISEISNLYLLSFVVSLPQRLIHFTDLFKEPAFGFKNFLYWRLVFSFTDFSSCCSGAQLCPTLCNPMNCCTSGFPVRHYLLEFAQIHVHWVSDTIQPSHPLLSSSLALSLSQHQGFFQQISSSHQVLYWPCKVLHQSIGASASTSIFPMNIQDWFPLGLTGLISLLPKGLSRVFSSITI